LAFLPDQHLIHEPSWNAHDDSLSDARYRVKVKG